MSFEAIAPPSRSRLWEPEQVNAAAEVLAEHGRVGWAEPYKSEGKARSHGSALARLLSDRTKTTYRVSVFERGDDAPNGAGFYFSLKAKPAGETDVDYEQVNPDQHKRDDLVALAESEGVEVPEPEEGKRPMSKAKIADAINAKRAEQAAAAGMEQTDTGDGAGA
jgi:hypothetical protein